MKALTLCLFFFTLFSHAFAQDGTQNALDLGGNSLRFMVTRKDVQQDLRLTRDQVQRLSALNDRNVMRAYFGRIMQESGISDFNELNTPEGQKKAAPSLKNVKAEIEGKINHIVSETQSKRMDEILIQLYGNRSVMRPEVAKAIGLSEDQVKAIANLNTKAVGIERSLFKKMEAGSIKQPELDAELALNEKRFESEIEAVISKNQKAKLKEMGGKKFERKDEGG